MADRLKKWGCNLGWFFRDGDGTFSFARLGAAFCLIFSAVAFFIGIHWKELSEHCHRFIQTMTSTALGLYGSSKVQQAVGTFSPPKPLPPSPVQELEPSSFKG